MAALNQYGLEMDKSFANNSDTVLVTTHHYYLSKECIGQGATSCVYKGQHRATGEERALKVSKQNGMHRETQREIEAFLILRHPNIVTFYGIEEDVQSGRNVIVMEYCSGGSLFSYLQEPENKRGLPDSEFLILIKHLRAAIDKLNSCGFIHRDIKPGNVLRSIDLAGKSVYKISDFGSARPLESDDHLVSLAGTEEYLHPLIYEKAFINISSRINFKASMDRWSLGATLCHAATGDVPFKPHGGARKNRNVMYEMISKKPSGKIRCIQEKDRGKIHWFDDLPAECNMTDGLRARVRPVIAGLMETNERKQWTVQTFIYEVDRILQSVIVHVLNTDICAYHTLYMDPGNTFVYISENVASQTDIPSAKQKYFMDHQSIDNVVSSYMPIKDLITTSKDRPFICIFLTDDDECCFPHDPAVNKSFPEVFLLTEDCKLSSEMSLTIYNIYLRVDETVKAQTAITKFARDYRLYMSNLAGTTEKDFNREFMIFSEKLIRFRQMANTMSMSSKSKDSSISEKYKYLFNIDFEIKKVVEIVKRDIFELKKLQSDASDCEEFLQFKLCSSDCVSGIEHVFRQSKDIVRCMCKRRKSPYITHMEEVRHKNDKKKILGCLDFAIHHWKSCCKINSQKLTQHFKKWMRYQREINHKLDSVREHNVELQNLSRSFTNGLTTFSAYGEREWSMMMSADGWKSLLQQNKDNETEKLINEGRQLMRSLSTMSEFMHESCSLDTIGDIP